MKKKIKLENKYYKELYCTVYETKKVIILYLINCFLLFVIFLLFVTTVELSVLRKL